MKAKKDFGLNDGAGTSAATNGGPSSKSTSNNNVGIPEVIVDSQHNKSYALGEFLGKGRFSECYKATDLETKVDFACKIVNKKKVIEKNQIDAMTMEINTHCILKHKNIVKFISAFGDKDNLYIILELCPNKSLADMLQARKTILEKEARFFVKQILEGLAYLHASGDQIIHRDLKPGNIFLGPNMEVKIGDFGSCTTEMAEKMKGDPELNETKVWTTSIYLPPEMTPRMEEIQTCQVDIWTTGLTFYQMLVGRVPFEEAKGRGGRGILYRKICAGKYDVPPNTMSKGAEKFLASMLQVEPALRLTAQELLNSDYIISKSGIPKWLPISALTKKPTPKELCAMEKQKKIVVPLISNVEIVTDASTPVLSETLHAEEQSGCEPSRKRRKIQKNRTSISLSSSISALVMEPITEAMSTDVEQQETMVPLIENVETAALTPALPESLHAEEQSREPIGNGSMSRKRRKIQENQTSIPIPTCPSTSALVMEPLAESMSTEVEQQETMVPLIENVEAGADASAPVLLKPLHADEQSGREPIGNGSMSRKRRKIQENQTSIPIPTCPSTFALVMVPIAEAMSTEVEKQETEVPLIENVETETGASTPVLPEPLNAEKQSGEPTGSTLLSRKRRRIHGNLTQESLCWDYVTCSLIPASLTISALVMEPIAQEMSTEVEQQETVVLVIENVEKTIALSFPPVLPATENESQRQPVLKIMEEDDKLTAFATKLNNRIQLRKMKHVDAKGEMSTEIEQKDTVVPLIENVEKNSALSFFQVLPATQKKSSSVLQNMEEVEEPDLIQVVADEMKSRFEQGNMTPVDVQVFEDEDSEMEWDASED